MLGLNKVNCREGEAHDVHTDEHLSTENGSILTVRLVSSRENHEKDQLCDEEGPSGWGRVPFTDS